MGKASLLAERTAAKRKAQKAEKDRVEAEQKALTFQQERFASSKAGTPGNRMGRVGMRIWGWKGDLLPHFPNSPSPLLKSRSIALT